MEEGFDDSDSAANKVLPTSHRQCRSLCRRDGGSTLRFMEPATLMPCIGTMNCPADVAQSSSPASSPGVSPGVRAGGETPPQLAAGTAALRGGHDQGAAGILPADQSAEASLARCRQHDRHVRIKVSASTRAQHRFRHSSGRRCQDSQREPNARARRTALPPTHAGSIPGKSSAIRWNLHD